MGQFKENNKGFLNGITGGPPPLTGSTAEWQGYQEGVAKRNAGAPSSIEYPPAVERILHRIGNALSYIGFPLGVVIGLLIAFKLGAGIIGFALWALACGILVAGLGYMAPRFILYCLGAILLFGLMGIIIIVGFFAFNVGH
jgi:hypothetical protein